MSSCILSIDQGTTGSTALLIDERLNLLAKVNREYRQIYPRPGWVEHDPEDIWESVRQAVSGALAESGVDPGSIAAIGITNQRETTVLWDRATGRPLHNAIVWQCRRTADRCDELKRAGHEPLFRQRTGLVLDAYFSGTKIAWLLEAVRPDPARTAAGTIDSFLTFRLTGGQVHVTDVSNASRTLLMDIRSLAWDGELCRLLGVPERILPEIRSSAEVYGRTRGLDFLPDGIPVAGMAGDQQAALFGQACFESGAGKCTYGTGAFFLVNTGERPVESGNGLLTTVGWQVGGRVAYALEGSVYIAGAAVQWLRDGLGIIRSAAEIESLAARVPDAGGVVFVPALVGLGAPHWNPHARGVIHGLTRGTTAAHLARACLEGIAFQVADLARAMENDIGRPISELKVDGGACANDLLMQFQTDILGCRVTRPRHIETTGLGAAFLAGLGAGVWADTARIAAAWSVDRRFEPAMDAGQREARLERWRAVVSKA